MVIHSKQVSHCWNNKRCCHFLLYKFWFQKRKHSQLSLKCSHVHIEMNYESLKEVTGQIVSVVWHYCQRFSLRCWGKLFQWLPKDWHKKVSDFCKMKHVHFAADWMNKFPNRGRCQIANIISWQNSLYCSQLSTSTVKVNNFDN